MSKKKSHEIESTKYGSGMKYLLNMIQCFLNTIQVFIKHDPM